LYLWVLFGLFVLHERIILDQKGIGFAAHGFAVFNAFLLAKVMLVVDHLNPGRYLEHRPKIFLIIHDSLVFSLLFIIFHVCEAAIVNLLNGHRAEAGLPNIGGGGISGIVCVAVILFFCLVPFFAFRHVSRAIGSNRMKEILLSPDMKAGASAG
jgi:hypothetical protein